MELHVARSSVGSASLIVSPEGDFEAPGAGRTLKWLGVMVIVVIKVPRVRVSRCRAIPSGWCAWLAKMRAGLGLAKFWRGSSTMSLRAPFSEIGWKAVGKAPRSGVCTLHTKDPH